MRTIGRMRLAIPAVDGVADLHATLHAWSPEVGPLIPLASTLPDHRWLPASALQKSVRRGHADLATKYALALHALNPVAAWRRLAVMSLEDVSFGGSLVAACTIEASRSVRLRQKLGELQVLAACAQRLAESVKCRSVTDHLCAKAPAASGNTHVPAPTPIAAPRNTAGRQQNRVLRNVVPAAIPVGQGARARRSWCSRSSSVARD